MKPDYRIEYDGRDITDKIRSRFVSLQVIDDVSADSDDMELRLSDHDGKAPLPPRGIGFIVYMGYDGELTKMGEFISDQASADIVYPVVTIQAAAANMSADSVYKSQRTETWSNISLGDLLQTIAQRNEMALKISDELAQEQIKHMVQNDESDSNFVVRLGRRFGAVATVKSGSIVFKRRGDLSARSGKKADPVTITPQAVISGNLTLKDRHNYGCVVAQWHDFAGAKIEKVIYGENGVLNEELEPVLRLQGTLRDQDEALRACRARYRTLKRGNGELRLTMPGMPKIIAETPLKLEGFQRAEANTEWTVKRVTHLINEQGFTTSVEAELPSI